MHYRDLRRENARNYIDDLTHEVVCDECGKAFEIRFLTDYAYKVRRRTEKEDRISYYRYFCSYTCFRAMEKRRPEKPLKGENVIATQQRYKNSLKSSEHHGFMTAMTPEELEQVYSLFRAGMDMKGIAKETGRSYDTVRRKLQKAGYLPAKRVRARIDD